MASFRSGPRLIDITDESALLSRLDSAGVTRHRAVIVVVGGASGLAGESELVAGRIVEQVIIPVAIEQQAVIVDGGTDSGVMGLTGRAHRAAGCSLPLVGVVVSRLVRLPGRVARELADDAADPEPHHTHLVLVPGAQWGDESAWLSSVALVLSAGRRAVTVLINGGEISVRDAARSVAAKRPVVAVAGSGRAADQLAADVLAADQLAADVLARGEASSEVGAFDIGAAAQAGLIVRLDASASVDSQRALLTGVLLGRAIG